MAMGFNASGPRRRRGGKRRAAMSEINVTPLVDVMLVLLIIFMVTAPLLKAGVPVELPESRAQAVTENTKQINLTLTRDGAIELDGRPVPQGTLPARLASVPPGPDGQPPLVTLRADRALDYGRVMAVMGELNRAGFRSISLVTTASAKSPEGI